MHFSPSAVIVNYCDRLWVTWHSPSDFKPAEEDTRAFSLPNTNVCVSADISCTLLGYRERLGEVPGGNPACIWHMTCLNHTRRLLALVGAMNRQETLRAQHTGKVKSVHVKAGQDFAADEVMIKCSTFEVVLSENDH